MELSIAGLLIGAGYMMSKSAKTKREQQQQQQQQQDAAGREKMRAVREHGAPSQQDIYQSTYWQDGVKRDEINRAAQMASAASSADVNTGVINPNDRKLGYGNRQRLHGNDDPRMQVYQNQPRVIVSPLTGKSIHIEDFTTQGMVPFYGGTVKQPSVDKSDIMYNSKLETYTGAFSLQRPASQKEAAPPLFQPSSQGIMGSSGRAISGGDSQDRALYLPSNKRNFELPPELEREWVGKPGVVGQQSDNIQYEAQKAAMERGMYPTVDSLRVATNPKVSFEGRVIPGKAIQSPEGAYKESMIPEVAPMRRGGPVIREIKNEDDMIRTTGAYAADKPRPGDYRDIRSTHRQATSTSYFGTAGSKNTAIGHEVRDNVFNRDPMPQLPALPLGVATAYAADKKGSQDDYGRKAIQVYGNNRDITTVEAPVANFASVFKALTTGVNDMPKVTRKQMLAENEVPLGNAKPSVHRQMTYYDPETGIARTSLKETTLYEPPLMAPDGTTSRGPLVYDPDEWRPGTTLKQLITDRGTGHTDGSIGGAVNSKAHAIYEGYDAPITQRSMTEATRGTAYGIVDSIKDGGGYQTAQETTFMDPTHRQTTSTIDHYGQARGGQTATVSYDAEKAMRHDECRETTLYGRSPAGQGVKQSPDTTKMGSETVDPRQLPADATTVIPMAPTTSKVPTELLCEDSSLRTGIEARAPPHDDENIDSYQSRDRFSVNIASSQVQRENNPFVVKPGMDPPSFAEPPQQIKLSPAGPGELGL